MLTQNKTALMKTGRCVTITSVLWNHAYNCCDYIHRNIDKTARVKRTQATL